MECEWKVTGEGGSEFEMRLVVPPNSSAVVTLPSELRRTPDAEEKTRMVGSGTDFFECRW